MRVRTTIVSRESGGRRERSPTRSSLSHNSLNFCIVVHEVSLTRSLPHHTNRGVETASPTASRGASWVDTPTTRDLTCALFCSTTADQLPREPLLAGAARDQNRGREARAQPPAGAGTGASHPSRLHTRQQPSHPSQCPLALHTTPAAGTPLASTHASRRQAPRPPHHASSRHTPRSGSTHLPARRNPTPHAPAATPPRAAARRHTPATRLACGAWALSPRSGVGEGASSIVALGV